MKKNASFTENAPQSERMLAFARVLADEVGKNPQELISIMEKNPKWDSSIFTKGKNSFQFNLPRGYSSEKFVRLARKAFKNGDINHGRGGGGWEGENHVYITISIEYFDKLKQALTELSSPITETGRNTSVIVPSTKPPLDNLKRLLTNFDADKLVTAVEPENPQYVDVKQAIDKTLRIIKLVQCSPKNDTQRESLFDEVTDLRRLLELEVPDMKNRLNRRLNYINNQSEAYLKAEFPSGDGIPKPGAALQWVNQTIEALDPKAIKAELAQYNQRAASR